MAEPRSTHSDLFADLEAFYAYETGSTASGKHDPELRARRMRELKALNPWENAEGRRALSVWVRNAYLSDEAQEAGYGWEDALSFLAWINGDV